MTQKKCQSCGMPMNSAAAQWGTNDDGSASSDYCSFCFQDGLFTQPDITVGEMQKFCIEKMKEQGFPRFLGWLFTRSLPKLSRWAEA